MATYLELYALRNDSDFQDKVAVATAIKAQTILDSATPTAAEVTWAEEALQTPKQKAVSLINYVLAANESLTVAQIQAATDSAIQSNVNAAVDVIISGGA